VKRLRFVLTTAPRVHPKFKRDPDALVSFAPMDALADGLGGFQRLETKVFSEIAGGSYNYFEDGDILLAKVTPCFENGKKAIAANLENGAGFATSEVFVFRPDREEIDTRYLNYLFCSETFRHHAIASMTGAGGLRRVSERAVLDFALSIPNLATQRRIVEFLDARTGWIDRLIGKKRRLAGVLAEKSATLIAHAVTKGLDPTVPMKITGIDWLGGIPPHWAILPLNRIIRLRSGDFISRDDIDLEGSYPVYGGNGVRGHTEQFNTVGPIVLVGRQGAHCGNVHMAKGEIWVSEHALRCFPEKKFDPDWLGYALDNMNLNQYSVSAAQPGLSVDSLKHLWTPVPPLDAQRRIARFLDLRVGRIDRLIGKVEVSMNCLKEYRDALITATVMGKLGGLND